MLTDFQILSPTDLSVNFRQINN